MTLVYHNKYSSNHPAILHMVGFLLIGGCINGLIAETGRSWQEQGWGGLSSLFGIGFYVPAIMFIGFETIQSGFTEKTVHRNFPVAAALLFLLAVLVPSSLMSWIAIGIFSGFLALIYKGQVRLGSLFFTALAACVIWLNFGFKLFVEPLTLADAVLTQHILDLLGHTTARNANILTQNSGFSVIILSDCSTWKSLPLEILSFLAISIFGGASIRSKRIWVFVLAMIPIMICFNLIRLTIISLSSELHGTVHGDFGRSLYDVVRVAAVFTVALFVSE